MHTNPLKHAKDIGILTKYNPKKTICAKCYPDSRFAQNIDALPKSYLAYPIFSMFAIICKSPKTLIKLKSNF